MTIPQFKERTRLPELRPQILDLWNEGRDTAEIARILSIRECQAYNTLVSVDTGGKVPRLRLQMVPR